MTKAQYEGEDLLRIVRRKCKFSEISCLFRVSIFFVFVSCFDIRFSCLYRYTRNKKNEVFVFSVPNSGLHYGNFEVRHKPVQVSLQILRNEFNRRVLSGWHSISCSTKSWGRGTEQKTSSQVFGAPKLPIDPCPQFPSEDEAQQVMKGTQQSFERAIRYIVRVKWKVGFRVLTALTINMND